MRGNYLHNIVLIGRVEEAFALKGWDTTQERYVSDGDATGFIDLVAREGSTTIAIEAELTTKRVKKDIWKATVLGAGEIWILVPNVRVAQNVRKLFSRKHDQNVPTVFVLTLGQALTRVYELSTKKDEAE